MCKSQAHNIFPKFCGLALLFPSNKVKWTWRLVPFDASVLLQRQKSLLSSPQQFFPKFCGFSSLFFSNKVKSPSRLVRLLLMVVFYYKDENSLPGIDTFLNVYVK
jgi:hypothetical protein